MQACNLLRTAVFTVERNHTNVVCTMHDEVFSESGTLNCHMRVHMGDNLHNVCNLLRLVLFAVQRSHTNVVCMTKYLFTSPQLISYDLICL